MSFLRGFSAPVRVDDDLTEEDLIVLSRHDSDNFNRWQSLQSLATRILLRGVKAIRAGRAPERNGGLVAAFGALIEDVRAGRIDHAFAALAMGLPSEADIAREIGEDVDPDAIHAARKAMRGALGRTLRRRARRAARRARRFLALQPRRRGGRPPRVAQRGAWPVRRRRRDRGTASSPIASSPTPTT